MELKETVSSYIRRPRAIQHHKNVVDAIIIQAPDLSLVIRIQNLVSFLLDNINTLLVADGNRANIINQIVNCIEHIKAISDKNSDLFDTEVQRLFMELVDECGRYRSTLSTLSDESTFSISSSDIEITAQSFQLQWLGVCLLEELKKTFLKK